MQLEEFLRSLQTLPESSLREELGVWDNYHIFLNAYPSIILQHFQEDERWIYEKYYGEKHLFQRKELPLLYLSLFDRVPSSFTTGNSVSLNPQNQYHSQRQLREFNITLGLNWGTWPDDQEKLATTVRRKAIEEICVYILEQKIPACLPAVGTRYFDMEKMLPDHSRIVYFP